MSEKTWNEMRNEANLSKSYIYGHLYQHSLHQTVHLDGNMFFCKFCYRNGISFSILFKYISKYFNTRNQSLFLFLTSSYESFCNFSSYILAKSSMYISITRFLLTNTGTFFRFDLHYMMNLVNKCWRAFLLLPVVVYR